MPPADAQNENSAPPETQQSPQTNAANFGPGIKATGIVANDGPKKPATTVTTGTLIMGTYEIEQLINSGGMGEVYRGRNIHNGEPVAIKIVLPSLAHDPKIVALFQKESTTLSRLSHEAIVRYHVFTVDPTIGRPCMVMEFVSGTAMSDRIEQGPMPLEDVRLMLRRVASGLDKAHRAGVVHRDLSPDNVILEEGMVEHAKLIDFGIAKSTAMGAGTLLQGQFAGKFNWVAPEQLGAFGGIVDGRSDIYSLALVTAGASRGEVLQMGASIVDAVGKRSSVPDLTGVDTGLVPLLTWMLQPDPALRPENMARVIAALDNPNLIPNAAPPEAKSVDPNRTIIGGTLPAFDQTLVEVAKSAAPVTASVPPAPTDWDTPVPGRQTAVPYGATVIADASLLRAPLAKLPPHPEEEPGDFSPFGAPSAPKATAPVMAHTAAPVTKKSKSGLIGVLAVMALGAAGVGAYYSGVFAPKPAVVGVQTTKAVTPEPVTPLINTAPADAKAAADAAAAKVKLAEAAAVAQAVKLAADQAAALKVAEAKAAADAKTALAATQTAAEQAAAKKVAEAAEAEAAQKAKDNAEAATIAAEQAATKQRVVDEAAANAAKAAAEATKKAADDAAAAQKQIEKQAAQDAAAKAAKADPILSQQAFFASFVAPECVYLGLVDPKPKGFVLDGYASETKPLEKMANEWTAATKTTPDVVVHLVSAQQCAAVNFARKFPDTLPKSPLQIVFDNPSAVIKNGAEIKGTISGLEGRTVSLFYIAANGNLTNMNKFTLEKEDGTVRFGVTMKIPNTSAAQPAVFLAVAGDKKITAFLDRIPEGKAVGSVFERIVPVLEKLPLPTASALVFVQVDN